MFHNLIIFAAVLSTPLLSSAETSEERIVNVGNRTIIDRMVVQTKKLTDPALVKIARDIVAQEIEQQWHEGGRFLKSFRKDPDDLNLKFLKTVDGKVTALTAVVNVDLQIINDRLTTGLSASCDVTLETVTGQLQPASFVCVTSDNEEIEWQR
jgi:hypothetical protein